MRRLLHRNVVKSRWVGRFIAFLERLIAPRKSPEIYQNPCARRARGAWEMRRLHTKSNWGGLRILNPRGKVLE